jgi:hypothetical protein
VGTIALAYFRADDADESVGLDEEVGE